MDEGTTRAFGGFDLVELTLAFSVAGWLWTAHPSASPAVWGGVAALGRVAAGLILQAKRAAYRFANGPTRPPWGLLLSFELLGSAALALLYATLGHAALGRAGRRTPP